MSDRLVSLDDIRQARARIGDRVHVTPTYTATSLGEQVGLDLRVKAELLQRTGSFKARGAVNTLAQLSDEARSRGVVSMSAGNHAAALAYGARETGTRAVVVMPASASRTKIAATRSYGGEPLLTDRPLEEVVEEIRQEQGLELVHPYDDPRVIAGAGTVGLEIVEQSGPVDAVLVPVGGGGLISGVAAAARALLPDVRVIGAEPATADTMSRAVEAGRPVPLQHQVTVADALAPPRAGRLNLAHVQELVDSVVRVDDAAIEAAVRLLVQRTKLAVEPGAAAGLAAVLSEQVALAPGSRVVLVLSGGNVDPSVLSRILDSTDRTTTSG